MGPTWSHTERLNEWQRFASHRSLICLCAQAEAEEARKLQKGGSPAPKTIPAHPLTAQRSSSLLPEHERALADQAASGESSDADLPPINGSIAGDPAANKVPCMVAMLDEVACASPHIHLPEHGPLALKIPCRKPDGETGRECEHRAANIQLPDDSPPPPEALSEPRSLMAALEEAAQVRSQLQAQPTSKPASELQCFSTAPVEAARSSSCTCAALETALSPIRDAGSLADSIQGGILMDVADRAPRSSSSSKMLPSLASRPENVLLPSPTSLEHSDDCLTQPGMPNGHLTSSSGKPDAAYLDWSQTDPLQMPMPASRLPSSEAKILPVDSTTAFSDGRVAEIHVPSSIKVPTYSRANLANVGAEQLQHIVGGPAVDSSDNQLVMAEGRSFQHGSQGASDRQLSCGRRRSLSPLKQAIRQHLSSGKHMPGKLSGSFKSSGPFAQDATVSDSSNAEVSACWLNLPPGVDDWSSQSKHCKCSPHPKQSKHVGQVSEHITPADGKLSPGQQKRYRAFRDSPTCIDCCRRGAPQCATHRCRRCCTAASLTCAHHARGRQRAPASEEGSIEPNLATDRVGT